MLDTLQNVKARLGITGADDDTFLSNQITFVSDVIEAYCRRKFKLTHWLQTFYREDLRSSRQIELYHYPVVSITSFDVDGVLWNDPILRVHKPTGIIRRTDGGLVWGGEITVQYLAGYETIPSPIIAVLDTIVSERYSKKRAGIDLNFGSDVQRLSIPGAISIDFDYSLSNNERKSAYGTVIGNHANVLDDFRSERSVIGSGKLEYIQEVG
jgi:hypothetical protein